MVAVISGNGLGLFNSSLAQTGRLHGGAAGLGQGNHSAMVNIANGNLLLAGNDESIDVNRFSLNILRTYNSQGASAGDLQQWLFSFETRLQYVAPLPSPGGKKGEGTGQFYRYAADGSVTEYEWDPVRGAHYSSDGDGAADFVRIGSNGAFEWVDGTTREVHLYDQEGRLSAFVDRNGNRWSIQRAQWGLETPILGKIYAIESDNGESSDGVHFEYGDFGELRALLTYHNGKLAHKVEYTYEYHPILERPSRLSSVRTHHLSGGGYFETSYQYESIASDRIVGLRQSDGVEVSFSYDAQGRVREVRRGSDLGGPQSVLTYLYDTANRKTTVQDGAGQAWVYAYDTQGRLTEVTEPAVNGQRAQTRYTYDARSNLQSVLQGRVNALNTFVVAESLSLEYDANDNLIWERDRVGNSVQRQYNASNQLVQLTRFTDLDPDGDGAQRPQQALSTRYVYDSRNNLRYEIDPLGNVVQYQVNQAGQVTRRTSFISAGYAGVAEFASMEAWANGTGGAKQITDYTYDFRGLLAFEEQYSITLGFFIDQGSQLRSFEGASVQANVYLPDQNAKFIAYTYDPQGLLRQVISYRGVNREIAEVTSMTYDGMGRLLTLVDPLGRTTSTVYNDAAGTITTSFANGLISRTEARDSQGRTVSVMQSDGTAFAQGGVRSARNYYDALGRLRASEDAAGGRTYFFYDAAGRLEAEVDPTGNVTRYTRDHAGRVLTATRYAQQVDTIGWVQDEQFVGELTLPASDPVNDRVTQSFYDQAGRLSYTIDGEGTRSNYFYDGANRLIRTDKVSASNPADVRRVRNFYDAADRLIGTLDEENYVVEHVYDRLGQLVKTLRYDTKSTAANPDTATFDELRPAAPASPPAPAPKNEITRYFYNGRGQRVGTLDAEMYLTHSQFAETLNQVNTVRYSRKVDMAVDDSTTLSALLSHLTANNSTSRSELHAYNSAGDLIQTSIAGLITSYAYNTHGQLILTSERDVDDLGAVVTREQRRRLNGFGQVVEELPASAPEEAWHLALKHEYDARGLRIQTTDAEGNRTWYFYDAAGRMTHELRGQSASVGGVMTRNARVEVSETLYNAFGEASSTIAYGGLIALQPPYNYAAAGQVIPGLSVVRDAAENTRVNYTYERRGLLRTTSNPLDQSVATSRTYDGFGGLRQLSLSAAIRGALGQQVTTYAYDKRGLLTSESLAHANGAQQVSVEYDAFGRAISRTDALDQRTTFEYDRLGRQIATTRLVHASTATATGQTLAHRSEVRTTTYDAFDRVLSETDALGRVTTYTYELAGEAVNDLRVRVTTPEGVSITTHRNHRGSTLRVEDGSQQVTRYYYDRDGRLTGVRLPDGSESGTEYDRRGLVFETTDATDRVTRYTYDAAGRVLTRTENAQAAAASEHLVTRYTYDGQGRQLTVTDGSGKLTTYAYWQDGQIKSITRGDPNNPNAGLEITRYTYDARGRQLTVVEGEGTAQRTTQYLYDETGRRVEEIVDPDGMKIRTVYAYDANGNVIAKHNPVYAPGSSVTGAAATATPAGVTRMVYDAANRLVFSIDPSGAVTQYHYDLNGRLTWTRAYATRPTLPAQLTQSSMLSAVNAITNGGLDAQSYIVRDRDGRERFILNADGSWTQYTYNALGQRSETITVGQPNFTAAELGAIRRGDAALATGVDLDEHLATRFDLANARRTQVVYDALGRAVYTLTLDSLGMGSVVTQTRYDAAGRVSAEIHYAKRILFTTNLTTAGVELRLGNAGAYAADQNRQTHYVYDGAGRLRYTLTETQLTGSAHDYAVTEQVYDKAGRVTETRAYREVVNLAQLDAQSIQIALAGKAVSVTTNQYDAAGRLETVTDALLSIERFQYNSAGSLVAYINKEGHRWTYELDAAGRRIREKSPQVDVSHIDANGNEVTLTRAIYTRTDYDAVGNVVGRTEDENFENLDQANVRPRTTEYEYDARGLQILTRFANAGVLDVNGRELLVGVNVPGPTLRVSYDALGRPAVQTDVRGFRSYKVHDAQGRLRYEVDQERQITAYTYNAFGEVTSIVRYANRLAEQHIPSNGAAITLAAITASGVIAADPANDRRVEFVYDRLGRKTVVTQSAVDYYDAAGVKHVGQPETRFTYDTYGRLVKESVLLERAPSERWADTFHWYDEAGRRIRTVDAERYVTSWTHDAQGRITSEIQYARQLDSSISLDPNTTPPTPGAPDAIVGANRVFDYQYDALGRRTHQFHRVGTTATFTSATTRYQYDREGRVISETHALSHTLQTITTRSYDALGRLIELRDPSRRVFNGDPSNAAVDLANSAYYAERIAATRFAYDAFGNATRVLRAGYTQAANGTLVDPQDTRETRSRYDRQGRLVWTQEGVEAASRKISWRYYDAADNVTKEVSELKINADVAMGGAAAHQLDRIVNSYTYDNSGRQTQVETVRETLNSQGIYQGYYRDNQVKVTHNAFGEVTTRQVIGNNGSRTVDQRTYSYDQAGRLSSTNDNEQGLDRTHGYNLAGHKVYESRPSSANAAVFIDITDRLGRAIQSISPRNSDDPNAPQPTVTRGFDRWGSLLFVTDALNNRTDYRYNTLGLVTHEEKATVTIVGEDGQARSARPTSSYFYDIHGRLTHTQDANGVFRYFDYAANGDLQSTTDGEGAITRYAYNSVGDQAFVERPADSGRGQVLYSEYDDRGRLEEQGDYTQNTDGTYQRSIQQRYVLNQDGHRLAVTNGMNETQRFVYNSRGQVTVSRTAMGVQMSYKYDELGRKVYESYDGLETSQTWQYDTLGRLHQHNDLSNRRRDYTYTNGLLEEIRSGATVLRKIEYFESGLVKRVTEGSNWTEYQYDANGNLIEETNYSLSVGGSPVHLRTRISYDANNRIETVKQRDLVQNRSILDLAYTYDAVGNRRSITAKPGNEPPSFLPNQSPATLPRGQNFSFDIAAVDPDGDALVYSAVLIINGQEYPLPAPANPLAAWLGFSTATGSNGSPVARFSGRAPSTPGTYQLRVSARDVGEASSGQQTLATYTLTVNSANSQPVFDADATNMQVVGGNAGINFQIGATDPDRDAISFRAEVVNGGNGPHLPQWLSLTTQLGINGRYIAQFSGTAPVSSPDLRVRLYARDAFSGQETPVEFTLRVTTSNQAPQVIRLLPDLQLATGATHTIDLRNHFADPEGAALSFTVNAPAGAGASVSGPNLILAPNALGSYNITVTARDPAGNPTPLTFNLSVGAGLTPLGPINMQQGQIREFNLLDRANPPDAARWSFAFEPHPDLNVGASFRYRELTPGAGAYDVLQLRPRSPGTYNVVVKATLDGGATVILMPVTVIVNASSNQPPAPRTGVPAQIVYPEVFMGGDNNPIGTVTANFAFFSDPEGSTLTYEFDPARVSGFDGIQQHPNGGFILTYEKSQSGEPNPRFANIRVRDASGVYNNAEHDIFVRLGHTSSRLLFGPTLTQLNPQALVNRGFTHAASQYFGTVAGQAGPPARSYSLINPPAGFSINATTGQLEVHPNTATGQYRVWIRATDHLDNNSASHQVELVVNVGDAGPGPEYTTPIPNQTATIGQPFSLNLLPNFSPAGAVSLELAWNNLPAGLTWSNGVISGTPTQTTTGPITVRLRATANGQSINAEFILSVQPAAGNSPPGPSAGWVGSRSFTWVSGNYEESIISPNPFVDPDNNQMQYHLFDINGNRVNGISVEESGAGLLLRGTYTIRPPGSGDVTLSYTLRATDGTYNDPVWNVAITLTILDRGNNLRPEEPLSDGAGDLNTSAEVLIPSAQLGASAETYSFTDQAPVIKAASQPQVQAYWFTYDKENRVRISNGFLSNDVIRLRPEDGQFQGARDFSHYYTYDKAGNIRHSVLAQPGTLNSWHYQVSRYIYDSRGQLTSTLVGNVTAETLERPSPQNPGTPGVIVPSNLFAVALDESERRTYDQAGRLKQLDTFFTGPRVRYRGEGDTAWVFITVLGMARSTQRFEYDQDGRVSRESRYARELLPADSQLSGWLSSYHQHLISNTPGIQELHKNSDVLINEAHQFHYHQSTSFYSSFVALPANSGGVGYDAGGRLLGFQSFSGEERPERSGSRFTHFSMNYEGWDGWVEKGVTGTLWTRSTLGQLTENNTSRTNHSLDAQGRRIGSVEDMKTAPGQQWQVQTRTELGLNAGGQIVARAQSTRQTGNGGSMGAFDRTQFAYAAGQQVARIFSDGTIRMSGLHTGFASSTTGTGRTTVYAGETLRSIAQRVYGDDSLWFVLAAANGLRDGEQLTVGSSLEVPQRITQTNSAGTFKPYNAGETSGIELPAVGYIPPAPKASCNPLQIVMIVVAVVVTVYTAGAAAGAFANAGATVATTAGTTATGFASTSAVGSAVLSGTATGIGAAGSVAAASIGGFAGSVASQLVGKALGVTDSFSLRQAVGSGLTAGLTAGAGAALSGASGTLSKVLSAEGWRGAASSSVLNSLTGQAGSRLAGLDTSFSWRSVAANAVAASISASVTSRLSQSPRLDLTTEPGQFGLDVLGTAVGGVVSLHTRRAAGIDQRVDYGQVAVDAFGNAIANALTGEHSRRATNAAWRQLGLDPSAPLPEGAVGRTRDGGIRWATGAITYPTGGGLAGVSQLQAGPLEGFQEQNVAADLLADIERLRIRNPNQASFRTGVLPHLHNRFVDYVASNAILFGDLGSGFVNLDAETLLAIQDGNDEFGVLRRAGVSSADLQGLSVEDARNRLRRGLLGSIAAAIDPAEGGLLQRTRSTALGSYDGDAVAFLSLFSDGDYRPGETSLAADIAVNVPLLGAAVGAGQAYDLNRDIRVLDMMRSVGMVSGNTHARAQSMARFNDYSARKDGLLSLAGPGKLVALLQGLDFAFTPGTAESAIGPKMSRAMSRQVTLDQYLKGEIQSLFHLDHLARGNLFEDYVLQHVPGAQRFGNFRTIDWFDDSEGLALSVKSVDLQAVSRLDPQRLEELLKGYVDKLAAFKGDRRTVNVGGVQRRIEIEANEINHRELIIGFEAGSASQAQLQVLNNLSVYATGLRNTVSVSLLPVR